MLKKSCLWSCLVLIRISKIEEIVLIYTRRDLGYEIKLMFYSWIEIDKARTWDVTNSKEIISVSEICRRDTNKNIIKEKKL